MAERIYAFAVERYEEKAKSGQIEPAILRRVERDIMLQIVDAQWKDHLYSLDNLKEGIGLRGYGQRDPLVEYKKEGYAGFIRMLANIRVQFVSQIMRVQPRDASADAERLKRIMEERAKQAREAHAAADGAEPAEKKPIVRDHPKIGRNDPCYCGSGKKYKKCHGAAEAA